MITMIMMIIVVIVVLIIIMNFMVMRLMVVMVMTVVLLILIMLMMAAVIDGWIVTADVNPCCSNFYLTGSSDRFASLWDFGRKKPLRVFAGHTGDVEVSQERERTKIVKRKRRRMKQLKN